VVKGAFLPAGRSQIILHALENRGKVDFIGEVPSVVVAKVSFVNGNPGESKEACGGRLVEHRRDGSAGSEIGVCSSRKPLVLHRRGKGGCWRKGKVGPNGRRGQAKNNKGKRGHLPVTVEEKRASARPGGDNRSKK